MIRELDDSNILDSLQKASAHCARQSHRALIVQPGAIGDCILTLPLAHALKERFGFGGMDMLAHTDYVGYYPNRTCIDAVMSIDAIDLYRLFVPPAQFNPADDDPLINAFSVYALIISFMGTPNSDFETNLIYAAHCTHSADVVSLELKSSLPGKSHITGFYGEQFLTQYGAAQDARLVMNREQVLIRAVPTDQQEGRTLLMQLGVAPSKPLLVIHPGSGGLSKCWCIDNFLAIAEHVQEKDWAVVFLLGPAELERYTASTLRQIQSVAPVLQACSLEKVLCVLECAHAFAGNDSGVSHMAGAMGLRTMVIFGSTDANVYRPVGPCVQVFQAESAAFTQQSSSDLQGSVLASLSGFDRHG